MRANAAGAIYGTVAIGALLAAETAQHETYGETLGAVRLAILLYWLAHAYAGSAAQRLEDEQPLSAKSFGRALVHALPLVGGAAVPALAVCIFGVAGASLSTAISAGVWTSAGVIVLIELVAASGSGARGRAFVAQAGLGLGLGLLVIAIKALLH
jgi:hypothetical protein